MSCVLKHHVAGRMWNVCRIKLYEHENDYNRAVGSYDLEMSANPSAALQVHLAKVCHLQWSTGVACHV